MLVYAAAALIALSALLVATARGIARAAVVVYVPVILFLSTLRPIPVTGFPDIDATSAVGYGILAVLFFRGAELRAIRINIIDVIMALLMGWTVASVIATSGAWNAVSATGSTLFQWMMPFVFGRLVMLDADARRRLFSVICISAIIIGVLAAIESRLSPYIVSRYVEQTNLISIDNTMVMYRYGFARAQVLSPHPIDLGNVGVLMGTIILVLAPILGRRWRQPLPLAGLMGSGLIVAAAISFTCFMALAVAFALLWVFSRRGIGKHLVVPAMISIIIGLAMVTAVLLARTVDPEAEGVEGAADASLWMRTVIVQGSWVVAQSAGLFGYNKAIPGGRIGTGSIDNAYMLFIMRHGWPYLLLWVALGLAIAWRGAAALGRARTDAERYPLAAGLAGILAILTAMYTVWFGFIYAQMFVFVVGMISSMTQMFEQRDAVALPQLTGAMGAPTMRRPQPIGRPAQA